MTTTHSLPEIMLPISSSFSPPLASMAKGVYMSAIPHMISLPFAPHVNKLMPILSPILICLLSTLAYDLLQKMFWCALLSTCSPYHYSLLISLLLWYWRKRDTPWCSRLLLSCYAFPWQFVDSNYHHYFQRWCHQHLNDDHPLHPLQHNCLPFQSWTLRSYLV